MKRCLILGNINVINKKINEIYLFNKSKDINIVGFSSKSNEYKELFGFKYYSFGEIDNVKYDYVIVAYENEEEFKLYKKYILNINDSAKVLRYEVVEVPFINMKKYLKLVDNMPTIFCNNCNGGLLSHSLFLKFNSPLVKTLMNDVDYLKFLKNPKKYLEAEIKPLGHGFDLEGNEYPTCSCEDIIIEFVHYKSYEEAIDTWNRRRTRVDYNNTFVLFVTREKKFVEEFIKLPYKKKVCICPFEYKQQYIYNFELENCSAQDWFLYMLKIFDNSVPLFDLVRLLSDARFVTNVNLYDDIIR